MNVLMMQILPKHVSNVKQREFFEKSQDCILLTKVPIIETNAVMNLMSTAHF